MELITIFKILHLFGMMAGLGGALYTDFLMITRGIVKPLDKATLKQVHHLTRFVTLGLLVLWVSGIALAAINITTNPEFMSNDKFWAKVAIVAVLSINGLIVHHYVLGEAERSLGARLIFDSNIRGTITLATVGSVSFVSWTLPFVMGSAKELSYVIPFELFLFFWIGAILTSVSFVLTIVMIEEMWRGRRHVSLRAAA